ncbi:hypothetical protein GMAR_ORF7 [Golden Marseillevirus]|uniref:hypothetical protein n=1 Tax=Golden Marseillevirus TaxID=1720526 RepID=UPI000877AD95|nr:hypothetical protein GMAR_ORF7 [Golden Marseillevirus]ALX27382.1 hypothetical protein GMAR_ORF7 [Golden Marseillevirus]
MSISFCNFWFKRMSSSFSFCKTSYSLNFILSSSLFLETCSLFLLYQFLASSRLLSLLFSLNFFALSFPVSGTVLSDIASSVTRLLMFWRFML